MQPPVRSLLYAHGFISSPASAKVQQLQRYLARHHPQLPLAVPALSPKPALAMAALEQALAALPAPVGLIGSSMGGFYCAWLAEQHGLRAWLVNPLARPQRYLPEYLGEHVHAQTGERFCIDDGDAALLLGWQVAQFRAPQQVLLAVQTGDATLDCREALAAWPGVVKVVIPGGDHHFSGFDAWLPFGLRFFGLRAQPPANPHGNHA